MSHDVDAKLDRLILLVEHVIRLVLAEGKVIMDLATVITELKTNTDTVAARIDKLVAALASAPTASPAQIAELQALADHLKALGTDPANPLPPVPPPAP